MSVDIQAYREKMESGATYLEGCEIHEEGAMKFCIRYPGMAYSGQTLDFTNRNDAINTRNALQQCFLAGEKSFAEKLRRFIGVEK